MTEDRGIQLPEWKSRLGREKGFWLDRTLVDFLDERLASTPDRLAVVGYNSMTGAESRLTYRELNERVTRLAMGLVRLGVEKGDIVSCQLPNWWEIIAVHLAALRIGAIINPLVPIFRERELEFMLGWAGSKVLIVPEVFRGYDHLDLAHRCRSKLSHSMHILYLGKNGDGSLDELLSTPVDEDAARALFGERRSGPDDLASIMYTSGTTGQPKGVMHTSNSLLCNLIQFANDQNMSPDDITIMSSPLTHQTGFLYGIMQPIIIGGPVVLQDIWNAKEALELVEREGVTFTISATPFLVDYCEEAAKRPEAVKSLRIFVAAGAPIPRELARRASELLGASIVAMWGMTENGPACYTRPNDPPEKVFGTDGLPCAAVEARVVDFEGKLLPHDTEGRLQVRSPGNFVGYLKRPDLNNTDEEGWFDTGDLARIDANGYVRITGRSKDVIIRGGENIPVIEVENLLLGHPAVMEVAIVAMPDERLGERACAYVTLRQGQELSYREMVAYLESKRCAKQYIPERLEIIEAMPRTPSGKIQKFVLRERAQDLRAVR